MRDGHWNALIQVHIPKTGGTALWNAIRGLGVQRTGHSKPIPSAAPSGPYGPGYIVTVRDPVMRFVSAHANVMASNMPLNNEAWRDVEVMAREYRGSVDNRWPNPWPSQVVFVPQVEWVHSAERLRQPDIVMVLRTAYLDDDFEELKRRLQRYDVALPPLGDKRRNVKTDGVLRLSDAAVENLRAVYAEDVAMYEEVCRGRA